MGKPCRYDGICAQIEPVKRERNYGHLILRIRELKNAFTQFQSTYGIPFTKVHGVFKMGGLTITVSFQLLSEFNFYKTWNYANLSPFNDLNAST
jgi:hypothetical protein